MSHDIEYYNADNYITLSENEKSMIIKMDYRSLCESVGGWSYNREIKPEVVEKLYENIKDPSNNITWILTAVKERSANMIYLIDGQHRYEAIKKLIENNVHYNQDKFLYIQVYLIESIKDDDEYIIDLFIKLNNHSPLYMHDFPSIQNIKIIKKIIKDRILKNGISTNEKTLTAHQPRIHKKTLHAKFNQYNSFIRNINEEVIVQNLKIINSYISLKRYEQIFDNQDEAAKSPNKNAWDKAKELNFYLGFKNCNQKYQIDNIIKNIKNPEIFI
jgi:hypothetical protein